MKRYASWALAAGLLASAMGCSTQQARMEDRPPVVNRPVATEPRERDTAETREPEVTEPAPVREEPRIGDRQLSTVAADVTLTAKVKNALIVSKVDTGSLNVDTKNGVVMLKGTVPSAQQKSLAEKIAKSTQGVKSVKNHLAVAKE